MIRVAVVGGGVTGLAAALELMDAGADVTVFEASDRLGGRIRTEEIAGRPIDLGPDAFLARVPHALDLCRRLGLENELVHPAAEGASIWARGRLRPLPSGLVLGAPTGLGDLRALARAGLITRSEVARASLDLVRPATRWGVDPTAGELVRTRLGSGVFEGVVDPLIGGIHAGSSDFLSAEAAAPQLAAAAQSRSLMGGLRKAQRVASGSSSGTPLFASLRTGLGRLVDRLVEELTAGGLSVSCGTAVDSVPVNGFDATILATPSSVAAKLVAPASSEAGRELSGIESASVALAVLVYPATALRRPLCGTGFLVPRAEGWLLTACSYASAKWPHWTGPNDLVLRASTGRWGDNAALRLNDDELGERLHAELTSALDLAASPRLTRVMRWDRAFPQYRTGHLARVTRAETALARDLPSVTLAGAAYRGVGIAACVAQGQAAARRALGESSRVQ